jgi:hypothetical protein
MEPVGHLGTTLGAAYLVNRVSPLKLNLGIVAFSALLPDLVDKPLAIMGIGDGRYVGHTLLFISVTAALLSLRNKLYGLSLLFGGICHLVGDLGGPVPWFYPFVYYDFAINFNPGGFFTSLPMLLNELKEDYLSPFYLGMELVGLVILGLLYYFWHSSRTKGSTKELPDNLSQN